ncbi:MAG: bifunctional riboflavin kinase/FAD synthetase [Ignavibacteriae bacterium]|nr:bifunctional riboflavin kinase/FAD synthetase [Ignavibacteriota bacterium]
MIIVHSLQEVKYQNNSIITVGTFDGVHRGHQSIIKEVTTRARSRNSRSVIITFQPHPREIIHRSPVKLLTPLEERLELFDQFDVDITLVLQFTYTFSRQSSREFYERYVVKGIGVSEVIVGYDHMFGKDREAGVQELREMGEVFGFATHIVSPVSVNGEAISSSKIRELIARGDVEGAELSLNRPYSLSGIVVRGEGRGAQLGFPTANIEPLSNDKLIPADGVYFVSVDIESQHLYGMLNIGIRPTFSRSAIRVVEVNIFDWNTPLYDKKLKVFFFKRLRAEKRFSSQEEFIAQLHQDREACMKYIAALQPS